ncbi:MAG: hypothetical protein IKO34_04175 [Bacteroidales bacterium]|nr:hypothetical protein [Bacteroidales bacterium]
MHKLLGIYLKRKKNFFDGEFSEVIETVKKLCNPKNDNTYSSKNFFLMSYCDSDDEIAYIINDNILYSYSGYVYFHESPNSSKSIDRQRLEKMTKKNKLTVDNIEGNYNIVKYDLKKNKLSIQSDMLGLNVLFCYEDNNVFMFCSDYEPLVKYNGNKYKIDVDAIYEYVMVKAPHNCRTFFKDISIFPRNKTYYVGQYFSRYKSGKRIKIKYSDCSVSEITEKYFNALKETVNCMSEWYPDVPVCLTGGADTRMILGCMSEKERARHTFITIRNRNIEDCDNQDVVIARKLAEKYGLKHETINYELSGMSSIDNAYFERLFTSGSYAISGFCGSETTDLQQSKWFMSEICMNIIGTKNNRHSKDILKETVLKEHKYLNNGSLTFRKLRKDILSTFGRTDLANKLELYIPMFFFRSFLGCHWGGARGNSLMPGITNRHYLSPFVSKNCIYVLCSSNEDYLGEGANDVRNLIFKNFLFDYTDIESNSNLCDNKNCVLNRTKLSKDQKDFFNINYENIDHIFYNEYTRSLNVFNMNQIKTDYYDNRKEDSYVYLDLLLWFNYVSTI